MPTPLHTVVVPLIPVGAVDGPTTVIVPVGAVCPVVHPPVIFTVKLKVPPAGTFGVPLIVTTFDAHAAVTPEGKPVTDTPVAPVVL